MYFFRLKGQQSNFDKQQKSAQFNRLNYLLEQADIFSHFMSGSPKKSKKGSSKKQKSPTKK